MFVWRKFIVAKYKNIVWRKRMRGNICLVFYLMIFHNPHCVLEYVLDQFAFAREHYGCVFEPSSDSIGCCENAPHTLSTTFPPSAVALAHSRLLDSGPLHVAHLELQASPCFNFIIHLPWFYCGILCGNNSSCLLTLYWEGMQPRSAPMLDRLHTQEQ